MLNCTPRPGHPRQRGRLPSRCAALAGAVAALLGAGQASGQIYFRGIVDNFVQPTDPAMPSQGQLNYYTTLQAAGQGALRSYDRVGNDAWHMEHFGNLPCGITAAHLIFVVKPGSSSLSSNDSFGIDFLSPTNTIPWPNANVGPRYYIRIGADPGVPSILSNPWTLASYPAGAIINLDLSNMPIPSTGETNLIPRLNQYGYLNIISQDDSYYDYINLVVTAGGTPPNNSCADATILTATPVTGSTACATPDGSSSCGLSNGTNDVWYLYNAACTGIATLHTCGSAYDTVLNVYQLNGGTCPGGLEELPAPYGCNDDADTGPCVGSTDSLIEFPVVADQTYYIRVAGFGGGFGTFSLALIPPTGPVNDDCANATSITTGSYAFDNRCAMTDGAPATECWVKSSSDITGDLWYTYVAPSAGTLTVSTCDGADFDTRLSIYDAADPCASAEPRACSDDTLGCGGGTTKVSYVMASGATARLRVGGYSGSVGTGVLNLSFDTACPEEGSGNQFKHHSYYVRGTASGEPMSWCVNIHDSTLSSPPVCTFCDFSVASVAEGAPSNEVVDRLVFSINAHPLADSQLLAYNTGTFTDTAGNVFSKMKIQIGNVSGAKDFTLSLGASGILTCNPVPVQPATCTFNPLVFEIATSGQDCNSNGEDDAIDIITGVSLDVNLDGVPDECSTCPCDWDHSGSLGSQDFFDFIVAFFAGNADYNHDGQTTSQDFFDYLVCFFNPPAGC